MRPRAHEFRWRFRLRSPPAELWPLVSDTQLTNRLAGFPPMTFVEIDGPDGTRLRRGSWSPMGLPATWIEPPFHWIEGREYAIERHYDQGPMAAMRVQVTLHPEGNGTRIEVRMRAEPRGVAGSLLIRTVMPVRVRAGYRRAFHTVDGWLQGTLPRPSLSPARSLTPEGEARLSSAKEKLQEGFDPGLVERLCRHLTSQEDADVLAMRPYRLAAAWGVPRRRVLELFLSATRAGLLEMRWELICPLCRGPAERHARLFDLHQGIHCASCRIRFDAGFEESVELRFDVHPSIRPAHEEIFCSGGPRITPHIVAQQTLVPGERFVFPLRLAPDSWRIRGLKQEGFAWIDVRDDATPRRASLTLEETGFNPGRVTLGPGDQGLEVTNTTRVKQRVVIERLAWAKDAVCAAEVTSIQQFRDLFSAEVLRPGEQFGIRCLTFLFTDVRRSTELYLELGDAPAFSRVRDHFRAIGDCVRRGRGAVVKTIGDAVMGVFLDPADALATAIDIQLRVKTLNSSRPNEPPLVLRVGLHTGPCIAVNANDLLDYFGATVNFAARMEGLGEGGDIIATEALMADPGVRKLLEERGLEPVPFVAAVKGFRGDQRMHRIWPERCP